MKLPKFSDFASEESKLEGDKIRIDDVLNIELIVTGARISNSKFKDEKYLQLQVECNNKKHIIFTGSSVLTDQVLKYQDQIPFVAKIIKIKKYYTFA